MELRISVGYSRPKCVDHLQRWSRIFRSEETETDLSIWIPTEISGIFGIMESTQNSDATLSGCTHKQ